MNGKPRKVRCVETDEVFNSIGDAAYVFECTANMIWRVCAGHRKTANGYHFEYV